MKQIYSLVLACMLAAIVKGLSAQTILSTTVDPSNPTTADTIKIYIQNEFPSGGCAGIAYPPIQTGDTFITTGMHCLGIATYICYDYDTVIINPQPVGQYTFVFTLYVGYGFPSCSPSLMPSDTSEVSFTVTESTGLNEHLYSKNISIYPDPLTTTSILQLNAQVKNAEVVIYDMLGKEMERKKMDGNSIVLEKGSLESGVYFVRVSGEERQWVGKIIIE